MSNSSKKPDKKLSNQAGSTRPNSFLHVLGLIFFRGPKQLITSRISLKCAIAMAIMCAPSLLFCAILTIPAMLFESPQQQAYFYFAKILDQDPARWVVLGLAGLCALMSLAIPATMPAPQVSTDY